MKKLQHEPKSWEDVPQATKADLFVCECCVKVHVLIMDEDGGPLARFDNDDDSWRSFINMIGGAMAERFVQ
jgi:hypothetical protein